MNILSQKASPSSNGQATLDPHAAIPGELKSLDRWCCFQTVGQQDNGSKPKRVPIDATPSRFSEFNGQHSYASPVNAESWTTFEHARRYLRTHLEPEGRPCGLWFALNGDGLVGVDLDACKDPETKVIEPWALAIVKRLKSYSEVSPSGKGLRILVRGSLPPGGRRKGEIEVYDTARFMSVTGNVLRGNGESENIENRCRELLLWHAEVFASSPSTKSPTKENTTTLVLNKNPHIDAERLETLFESRPIAKDIFDGTRPHTSQSEGDLGLANTAVAEGWSDQAICDLIALHRQNWDASRKPIGYFIKTIRKARVGTTVKPLEVISAPVNGSVDRPKSRLDSKNQKPGTDEVRITGHQDSSKRIEVASMADVAAVISGVTFLVPDLIPFGMVSMLVGPPGVGKSLVALYALARPIVTGSDWFTGSPGPSKPGFVLWCDTESSAAITIERIKAWSLPGERILVPFHDDPLRSLNLTHEGDLERIEAVIGKYRCKLVVVDSLRGAHNLDENNSSVSTVVQRLATIAERTGTAVVVIHHTKKMREDEDITANSSRGSNALVGLVRSQIGIDKPDPQSPWCRLSMLKENLGLKPAPIGFRISDTGLEFGKAPERPRSETGHDRATAFLITNMRKGVWHSAAELTELAIQEGIASVTLHRARVALGITKPDGLRKEGGAWQWRIK